MKLKNKKTGEIVELDVATVCTSSGMLRNRAKHYSSLAELNEEWEDYREPRTNIRTYFYIIHPAMGVVRCIHYSHHIAGHPSGSLAFVGEDGLEEIDECKAIGNYFESKEEAERAVEKLKAYKRLKDKGFNISLKIEDNIGYLEANWQVLNGDYSDVKTCFGGEE